MDSDGFDDVFDDIPDEDLILALTQATGGGGGPQHQHHNPTPRSHHSSTTFPSAHSHHSTSRTPARSGHASSSRSAHNPVGGSLELEDIPSDAFDTSPSDDGMHGFGPSWHAHQRAPNNAPQNMRQTTLWGNTLRQDQSSQAQSQSLGRPFIADLPPEVPTHHKLNDQELGTWVYPLNLGDIRDYQYTIVKNGLFKNTLVALPTGLGKTFIAATVILNYLRWTKDAQVVFVAPTKPLAEQQVQACLSVVGIPRSQATLLTGETVASIRAGEWEKRRLFFMTPQTLMNDLSKGIADPKKIVLLIIDEAHRATGNYAYVKVVQFLRRFSKSFRVLALTATPGSSVEAVQDVITNLEIAHIEIRTEESLDIQKYVHGRNTEIVTFDPSDEMNEIASMFSKALMPLVDKLSAQNIYTGRDPMSLTTYGLMKTRKEWMAGPGRHVNDSVKWPMCAIFSVLQSLAHSIKLLKFHGIKPFYHNLAEFRNSEEAKAKGGSKLNRQVTDHPDFKKMMSMLEAWMKLDDFAGHPKLSYLCQVLVNHFMDAGENSATRSIVFSEYRDSAEEIVRLLNKQPLIKATVFVGQADSKRSDGMTQVQQRETIEKFKNGVFNVLVATSIGEEGLDIGQVDLIVCYDASASPIRMLQRMGRTGRKRQGNVVLLLMKGKEEEKFREAKLNYQKMQEMISEGSNFEYCHDLSTRILPRAIKPQVDKRLVEIPVENTQDPSIPEPRKGGPKKKAPPKKFNMPDGVITGFVKASMIGKPGAEASLAKTSTSAKKTGTAKKATPARKATKPPKAAKADAIVPVPDPDKVLLTESQTNDLNRLYRTLPRGHEPLEFVSAPNSSAFSVALRTLRPTVTVRHGDHTKRAVKLLHFLGKAQNMSTHDAKPYGDTDHSGWRDIPVPPFAEDAKAGGTPSLSSAMKRRHVEEDDMDVDEVEPVPKTKKSRTTKANEPDLGPKPKKPRAAATKAGSTKKPSKSSKPTAAAESAPAKKTGTGKVGKIANRNSRIANFVISDDEDGHRDKQGAGMEEAEEAESEEEEEEAVTPAAARGRGRQPKGASRKGRGGGKGSRRGGNINEDYGDSCLRTSDMEETDGSDDGADLIGFVIDDNDITSSMQREMMTSPPSPRTEARRERRRARKEAERNLATVREEEHYIPTSPLVISSDDDLPGIEELSRSAKKARREPAWEESEEERVKRPARKRRIVVNSDDEVE